MLENDEEFTEVRVRARVLYVCDVAVFSLHPPHTLTYMYVHASLPIPRRSCFQTSPTRSRRSRQVNTPIAGSSGTTGATHSVIQCYALVDIAKLEGKITNKCDPVGATDTHTHTQTNARRHTHTHTHTHTQAYTAQYVATSR